jgi:hypothetical protein
MPTGIIEPYGPIANVVPITGGNSWSGFKIDASRQVPTANENQVRTLTTQYWRLVLKL